VSATTGTWSLVRLALRRDRWLAPTWIAGFVLVAAYSAQATIDLYPTASSRLDASESINRSQALVALYGRVYDPSSTGALAVIKTGGFGALFVALLAVVLVIRHTTADEESGCAELVGATATGRQAPLAAAFVVAGSVLGALAVLTAAGLAATGLPLEGSIGFGLAWAGIGLAFAAVGALVGQLTTSSRTALGLSSAVLAVVYALRATGDTAAAGGARWLSWLSPIGWAQQFRPYAGDRWWVLAVTLAFAVVAGAGAFRLRARRDLGAGLLPARPGPAGASPWLRGPVSLAWRLQRVSLGGWAFGFLALGALLGGLASSVGDLVNNPNVRDFIRKLGGRQGLTDAYLSTELGIAGVIAAAYGIQALLRLRSEETALHAEPVLATAVSRLRWAAGHLLVAVAGSAALLLLVGSGAAVAHGAATGDAHEGLRVLGAALVRVPAAWVLVGIAVVLVGLAPRATSLAWVALVTFVLVGEFGPLFGLPQAVMDLSPFTHVPRLPGAAVDALPLVALTLVAGVLTVAGLAGLRRRDFA